MPNVRAVYSRLSQLGDVDATTFSASGILYWDNAAGKVKRSPRISDDGTNLVVSRGQVHAPDGSAGSPSYSFGSDTDTGIRWITSGIAGMVANGLERAAWDGFGLRIHPAGNISWVSGSLGGSGPDTTLSRVAAGIVGVTTGIALGASPAPTGNIRLPDSGVIRFNAGGDRNGLFMSSGISGMVVGDAAIPARVRGSLGTPGSLINGDWWVDASGSSPSRTIALKVRDGGATHTVASITV